MRIHFQIMLAIGITLLVFISQSYGENNDGRYKRRSSDGDDDDSSRGFDNQNDGSQPGVSKHSCSNGTKKKAAAKQTKQYATSIAVKAAQEAKRANDEMCAVVKALSQRIKDEYAERALVAAKAAEAVLAGKTQVLEQMQSEVREAEVVVQEELQSLSSAEATNSLAIKACSLSKEELKLLRSAQRIAKMHLENADQVSGMCEQTLTKKQNLVEAAQKRVSELMRQLNEARADYTRTKKAADRARCAALEAKGRVDRQRRMAKEVNAHSY